MSFINSSHVRSVLVYLGFTESVSPTVNPVAETRKGAVYKTVRFVFVLSLLASASIANAQSEIPRLRPSMGINMISILSNLTLVDEDCSSFEVNLLLDYEKSLRQSVDDEIRSASSGGVEADEYYEIAYLLRDFAMGLGKATTGGRCRTQAWALQRAYDAEAKRIEQHVRRYE